MPLLTIETNYNPNDLEESGSSYAPTFSKAVAQMLGKPEQYVMVKIATCQEMIFAGSSSPAAYVQLKSLGLDEAKTKEYSATLCKLVSSQFNIPKERIYIEFSSPQRHMWGWDSKTF